MDTSLLNGFNINSIVSTVAVVTIIITILTVALTIMTIVNYVRMTNNIKMTRKILERWEREGLPSHRALAAEASSQFSATNIQPGTNKLA